MTLTTTRRAFHALVLGGLAATAALPARAAVIQSDPVAAAFAGDASFDPSFRGLTFDASLGTLTGVTLAFDGTVAFNLAAPIAQPAPYPATVAATVSVIYGGGFNPLGGRPTVVLDPIVAPLTVSDPITPPTGGATYSSASASGSAARSFTLEVPAALYGTGALHTDFAFDVRINTPSTVTDAFFRGTITALFDYVPLSGDGPSPVPEPAGLALLGFGLAVTGIARTMLPKKTARRRV